MPDNWNLSEKRLCFRLFHQKERTWYDEKENKEKNAAAPGYDTIVAARSDRLCIGRRQEYAGAPGRVFLGNMAWLDCSGFADLIHISKRHTDLRNGKYRMVV